MKENYQNFFRKEQIDIRPRSVSHQFVNNRERLGKRKKKM